MKKGDAVDWNRRNTKAKWHGVVVHVHRDGNLDVFWLKSDVKDDYSATGSSSRPRFYRGYTTREKPSDLLACDDERGTRHPKTNPWGEQYGIPD